MAAEHGWEKGSPEYEYLHERLMGDREQAQQFADTDNDGAISLEEWLVFCDHFVHDPEMYQSTVTNIAAAIIESADTDGNGKLSPGEWAMIFRVYGWREEATAHHTFTRIDQDEDGLVTKQELLDALDVFFKSDDESQAGNYIFGHIESVPA